MDKVAVSCAFAVTSFAASASNLKSSGKSVYNSSDRHTTSSNSNVKSIKLSKSSLTLTVGETYTLSSTVTGKSSEKVTWSSSNKKVATVSSGKVVALKVGRCTISAKAGGKTANCNVTVKKATATKTTGTIKSIHAVSVSTTVGTIPVLPSTVTAVYSNGAKKNVTVTWASISSSEYASAGTFTVYGTVSGTSIQAVATVTVTDDSSYTIASIDAVSVSTTIGKAPTLPSTVTAVLENGSTESVSVTWASISSSLYASAGTFTVYGTVSGTSIQAVTTVTVTAS